MRWLAALSLAASGCDDSAARAKYRDSWCAKWCQPAEKLPGCATECAAGGPDGGDLLDGGDPSDAGDAGGADAGALDAGGADAGDGGGFDGGEPDPLVVFTLEGNGAVSAGLCERLMVSARLLDGGVPYKATLAIASSRADVAFFSENSCDGTSSTTRFSFFAESQRLIYTRAPTVARTTVTLSQPGAPGQTTASLKYRARLNVSLMPPQPSCTEIAVYASSLAVPSVALPLPLPQLERLVGIPGSPMLFPNADCSGIGQDKVELTTDGGPLRVSLSSSLPEILVSDISDLLAQAEIDPGPGSLSTGLCAFASNCASGSCSGGVCACGVAGARCAIDQECCRPGCDGGVCR